MVTGYRMRATVLFLLATLAGAAPASAADPAGDARPNIIYFNADDLGVMDVGFNRRVFQTPHIDRLASEGMVFTQGYAPAANCAPSRAVCMSGQYTPRHGVYTVDSSARGPSNQRKLRPTENTVTLREDIVTIAEALKAGGYATIHLGKWHLSDDPTKYGFDVNIGGNHAGGPYGGGYFSPWTDAMRPLSDRYPKGTHRTEVYADEAEDFIEANQDRPFFVNMAYYSVHTPIQPVESLQAKYEGKQVHSAYASMVEKMDESIGRIVGKVDELGLAGNTLILFSSDNGGVFRITKQHPFRAGKGSYFEGGIREPMVVRWKGTVEAGGQCKTPVSGVDFYPTFLEVARLEKPEGHALDGVSMMPLLTGRGHFPERPLFWHFPIYLQGGNEDTHDRAMRTRPGSVVRLGKWKLHEYFEDGRLELYDLEADVGERRNLAADRPEKIEELRNILHNWRAELKAPVPTEVNPGYRAGSAGQQGR